MEIQTYFSGSSLTWQDYAVTVGLLVGMILVGMYFGRKEESTADFFLGDRKIPWWAACLSFVATEISAVTIISVPAIAYMENWEYAQFFIGSFLARVVIAFLFIPAFYHYNCTSIYEFLNYRFGTADPDCRLHPVLHYPAAGLRGPADGGLSGGEHSDRPAYLAHNRDVFGDLYPLHCLGRD